MTRSEDIYRLQRVDSERDAKQSRLAEVEAALKDDSALQQARQALESAEEQARQWQLKQRDQELEIEGLSNRISESEKRLYSGKVKNPKELSDLQDEVASLKRRRQRLEEKLLETMIEREEAEERRAAAQAHLEEIESWWSAKTEDLQEEREELQNRLEALRREREKLLPRVDDSDLSTYNSLRERKGGRAVAQVRDGICGRCGVAISSSLEWQLREGELVRCDNCERLLVAS